MRKLVLLLATLCCLPAEAAQPGADPAELAAAMAGEYAIVGRKPDSQATYTGKLVFRARGRQLDFTRSIGGRSVRGTAVFDTVAGDDGIPVVRLAFSQDGVSYAGTYQWAGDYDNYFRFTGYVYRRDGRTGAAGLEALFPAPPARRD